MILKEILKGIKILEVIGDTCISVTGVEIDSRNVADGYVFIAIRGTGQDGHAFIGNAVNQGASAVVCETLPDVLSERVTYVVVGDTGECVGRICTLFFGDPTSELSLVGVTGTNGKTTVATLLYNMFRRFGYRCGLISTVSNFIDGVALETDHTTPDPVTLNRLLGRMADEGCKYVFMECSSHAIAQKRIGGLKYAGGVFTNLTRDHLDYHKTVENYLKAKKSFFDALGKDAFVVTNADDKNGFVMTQNTKARVTAYSLRSMCDFKGKILESGFDGMLMDINGSEAFLRFIGRFNASNLLAVYGTACNLGQNPLDVLRVMSTLVPVDGRFEAFRSPSGYTAIVDYAHTPDALVNVLDSIREVMNGNGRIISVVGAGGNRDKGKRPMMASESAVRSDSLVLTSDNPRFEEPQDIINDMLAGLSPVEMKKTLVITDRREAIRTACMMARPGDVILVAGKGHETYQDIKGVKYHFDDREVLRDSFQ